eukprot:TRINITY_DN2566_c0_g1_i10.p5 TRINITY_DN2566_c0_g1~~TRINITY_DN2566_c0_g1_i10.p5  ORF type:complete len:126 (+),score=1.67 TRINITY_DN2566_c0_g1_i10:393-770(+)
MKNPTQITSIYRKKIVCQYAHINDNSHLQNKHKTKIIKIIKSVSFAYKTTFILFTPFQQLCTAYQQHKIKKNNVYTSSTIFFGTLSDHTANQINIVIMQLFKFANKNKETKNIPMQGNLERILFQ